MNSYRTLENINLNFDQEIQDVNKCYFCLGYISNLLTTLYASDFT